jgi:NTP pyrophosphatase (non-canonical NTP hydrolase)
MITNHYIVNALRSESTVDTISCNQQVLLDALSQATALSRVLDQLKKHIFYGNDAAIETAASLLYRGDPPDDLHVFRCEHFDINPRVFHAVLGKATEAFEMLEAIHQCLRNGTELDMVNLLEELGDSWWYDALLCDAARFSPEDVRTKNIAKLRSRYPDKFDRDKAANRDLGQERRILADEHDCLGEDR